MSVQTPVGVTPASKTVRRTIEVAVRRDTLEDCTLACMRCANFRKGFLQLEFPPLSPDKRSGKQFRGDLSESDVCFPATASSSLENCRRQWIESETPVQQPSFSLVLDSNVREGTLE